MKQERLVPKRRFEGFDDNWVKLKMTDVTSKIGDGLHGTPKYKKNGNVFFINGNNLVKGEVIINEETKRVSEAAQSKDDKTLCENTILMSINGTIGNLAWYHGEKLMLGKSVAYIKINGYDKKFIYSYLQTSKVYKYFINSLTGSTIKNLGLEAIRDTILFVPYKEEQQKIGKFFKHLDEMISFQQRKMDKTKALKSAYLSEMFPAEGERVPKRRFAGFTEEWEIKTFDSLLDKSEGIRRGPFGSALKKEYFVSNSNYVVYEQQNAIYDRYSTRYNITKQKYDELYRFVLSEGDFIMSGAGTIGQISRVPKGIKSGVINQALIRMRINKQFIDSEYFLQWMRSEKMQNRLTQANPASAMVNLVPMSDIKGWQVSVPIIEEQQKIGSFFKKLDDTITNHQHKLAKLKSTKQAYLHEMFV